MVDSVELVTLGKNAGCLMGYSFEKETCYEVNGRENLGDFLVLKSNSVV